MQHQKEVYIIGGPNGAGKTTFVTSFLPNYAKVVNFVNADEIARGLSPLGAETMNIKSGKIMLGLIDEYIRKGESFGFETTLAGKKWIKLVDELKEDGYLVYIFFLDLPTEELSVSRVKYRIKSGGHYIPEETVRRRYGRSRSNFWNTYKNKATDWNLFDNSGKIPVRVANGSKDRLNISDNKYLEFFINSIKENQ